MEKHTFATSAYIAAPPEQVFRYLGELKNLDEWTLFSRMTERVDDDTWIGTASGYQRPLYYHIRRFEHQGVRCLEWHCGFERGDYFQVYPVLVFEPQYLAPESDEEGSYFHWVSFVDPARRTAMIDQGIGIAHTAECRSLKAVLERRAGRSEAAHGRFTVRTDTTYIDAPVEQGLEFLADVRNTRHWAHLLRAQGEPGRDCGEFLDEYGQRVRLETRVRALSGYHLVEHDAVYPDHAFVQRTPTLLIPCSYAFGNPSARGFLQHRITFWRTDVAPRRGRLQLEDYRAESINIKRVLEARAGNLATFNRGLSYTPSP